MMTLELLSLETPRSIGMKIHGMITGDDLDRAIVSMETMLKSADGKLRVYVEVEEFSGMSPAALFKDLRFGLRHFSDVEKEAIVSDVSWLKALTKVSDRLFPSIEVAHFAPADRQVALDWLAK